MRLIDADQMAADESEAYLAAQEIITDPIIQDVNMMAHRKVQILLADTPTVDAVPVVFCRDCKHHQENEWFHYCKRLGVYVPDDPEFFCSDGERKEADHDEKAD